jgi:uncharacterized cupin superfamily protein
MGMTHMDDARRHTIGPAGVASTWTNLGRAVGTVEVGLRRIEIPAGERATPPHDHGAEEEIFYVLAGAGTLWQAGVTHEIGAGDCIVHLPRSGAHTIRGGPDGIDVLVFGERRPAELCVLPRTGYGWLGDSWVAAGEGDSPWQRDTALGHPEFAPPSPRPANVVNVDAVEETTWAPASGSGSCESHRRDLGRAAGSITTGLRHVRVPAGKLSAPPHCHAAEEELFVILDGDGDLVLIPGDETPVRAGHVISRPAGSRVAHAFRAGAGGLTMLAYSTRNPADIVFYPRSNKLYFRGLDVITRVERLDYWDGEE